MRDRTNISDALENHEENKNKDLSSTICEFVSLECTPQVRYTLTPHEFCTCEFVNSTKFYKLSLQALLLNQKEKNNSIRLFNY